MGIRHRLLITSLLVSAVSVGGAGTAIAQPDGGFEASAAGAESAAGRAPGGAGQGGDDRRPSQTAVRLKGLRGGSLIAGNKVKVAGTLRPFVKGQKVTVLLLRGKKVIERDAVKVKPKGKRRGKGSSLGQFSFSKRLIKQGRYSVQAVHEKNAALGGSKDASRAFKLRYPDLGPGASGDVVKTFNELLAAQGYVNDEGSSYDSATGRAVLAFRKVNKMERKESASSGIFETLANGRGGYDLKYPGSGKHVETDLSRQVMVLAKGGEVDEIYHISSGTAATPTITGQFNFYRKDAGYNSLGMYYSAYFIRGYATHGYASVPDYPASHGCLRNPIPDSVHIYNWIDIGDPIYVYH